MIWCLRRDVAQQRLGMNDSQFVSTVQTMLGPRIGFVTRAGPRSQFPLVQQRRPRLREHRLAYIGNAAQSLHPVAGQGFNLGMRDCACLSDCLARSSGDPIAALARYEAMRRIDRVAISSFTAWLPRLFSARSAPIAVARSTALFALDLATPLRRELASLLMFGLRL
jgi:2-octaprenyl-6-methoxyphenol hydroxylase